MIKFAAEQPQHKSANAMAQPADPTENTLAGNCPATSSPTS